MLWRLICCLYIFAGCQDPKGQRSQPATKKHSSIASQKDAHMNAEVAIDWYKLQLQISLYSSPQVSPLVVARNLGYVGIGLYESVRHGINGSVSFSKRLYQMPVMPDKENNNDYAWDISANAALAELVRSLYANNLTAQNRASIDSLKMSSMKNLNPVLNRQCSNVPRLMAGLWQKQYSIGVKQIILIFPMQDILYRHFPDHGYQLLRFLQDP